MTAAEVTTPPATRWRDRHRSLLGSRAYARTTDALIALAAASLPWSTTALAVFMLLWLVAVLPTIDWEQFVHDLATPACALPMALVGLALLGVMWSEATWAERLHGIKPVSKLLLLPFLLGYFQRSQRGLWVFAAFLISCTSLMMLSWVVLAQPAFKLAHTASDGVPVKNYLDQSQEFALCAFALALPALMALRARRWIIAAGSAALILLFVANMFYVVSARTALVYMPVLLILFAALHLDRRATRLLFAGVAVASVLVWTTSPYLRQRIADIAVEYRAQDTSGIASTAQRLTYWRKSAKFIAEAPWLGHGTGSIRHLFTHDAAGQTGLQAEVINNPHNQTLNFAIQWGLVGILMLNAMWYSHLRLFAGRDLVSWIGLAVVAQNVTSSLLNSHLSDFHEGWMYVIGAGVAGGMALRAGGMETTLDKIMSQERDAASPLPLSSPGLPPPLKLRRAHERKPRRSFGVDGTGRSGTPRPIGSTMTASGILDHPVKPGDDTGCLASDQQQNPYRSCESGDDSS